MKQRFKEPLIIILTYITLLILLLIRSKGIGNPFVLPDETAYINLIGKISVFFKFDGAQYPPMYPFLASLVYKNNNILFSYENIRILNVFFFSLTFFPLYQLVKRIFKNSLTNRLVLSVAMMILPWSSLISPIWAEPLYFLFFTTTFLLIYLSFELESCWIFVLTGTLIGLTFLTKQVGLIIGIAFYFTQLVKCYHSPNKKVQIINLLVSILPLFFIILAYKFLNTSEVGSPGIGYSNVVNAMTSRIFIIIKTFDFYRSFFHQISYLSVSTFFIFFASFIVIFFNFNSHSKTIKLFSIFVSLMTIGLCLFIAIFNNTVNVSYNDTNEPTLGYGRYLVALLPSFFILGSYSLSKINRNHFFLTIITLFLITSIFTPLHSSFASGIVGNPDVTYFCQFFNLDSPPWDRNIIESNLGNIPILLAFIFLVLSFFLFLLYKRLSIFFFFVIFALAFYVGYMNYSYTVSFSGFLKEESEIYKKIAEDQIKLNEVLIYDGFSPGIYISQFWNGFFDFATWSKKAIISNSQIILNNENLTSGKYKLILANKSDLTNFPTYFLIGNRKILQISEINKSLKAR